MTGFNPIQTIYPSGKDQLVVSASADCTAKVQRRRFHPSFAFLLMSRNRYGISERASAFKHWRVTLVRSIKSILITLRYSQRSKDNTCRIWDRKTGKCKRVLMDHKEEVRFLLRLSVCSRNYLTELRIVRSRSACLSCRTPSWTGSYDATLKIWGPSKVEPEYTLTGHNRRISTLHIFDGNKIVSGSWDTTVRLWEFEMDFRVR